MALTAAERQARYRRHKAGDHSTCDPDRCTGDAPVTSEVTGHVTSPRLGRRGRKLWDDLHEGLGPAELVLLEEACRIADRLDTLDRILTGADEGWMRLRVSDDGSEVTVTVDKALAEARQQAAVLKQIVAELRQSRGKQEKPTSEGGSDDLAARRAARRAAAGL